MIAALFAIALQSAAAPAAPAVPGDGQMRVFDMLCNRLFPNDAQVEAAMAKLHGARALTAAELRIYLKDDPGRGWDIPMTDGSRMIVTIEAPPYHACAVRVTHTDGRVDERAWKRLLTAAEARGGGGFVAVPVRSATFGNVRSEISGIQKQRLEGGAEAFYLFRTTPIDPARHPDYGVELRMVRQLIVPAAR